jgi:hypothetical protein
VRVQLDDGGTNALERGLAQAVGKLSVAHSDLAIIVAIEAAKQLDQNCASAEPQCLVGRIVDDGCRKADERLAAQVGAMIRTLLTARHQH